MNILRLPQRIRDWWRGWRNSATPLGRLLYGAGEPSVNYALEQASRGRKLSLGQLKLLPRLFTATERRTALWLTCLVVVASSLLLVRWYQGHTSREPQAGSEFVEGLVGAITTTNPLLATTTAEIDLARLTHRGLMRYDAQGQLIVDLADTISPATDFTSYRVTLKPNLRWSDGEPMTSDDIIFTYQSAADQGLKSPLWASLQGVTVTKLDETNVNFTLKEPYLAFPHLLTIGLIPSHIWQSLAPDRWLSNEANLKPIGSGPFRFAELTYEADQTLRNYTLEANPFTHTAQPFINTFSVRFYSDSPSAVQALREGSIDAYGSLSYETLEVTNRRRFNVIELELPQYTAVFFNPQQNEVLQNKLVRQALAYATNRTQLIKTALTFPAIPAIGPFTFGEPKRLTAGHGISHSIERAKELLTQAGYTQNSEGLAVKDNKPLELTLTVPAQTPYFEIAEVLSRQWRELGVNLNLETIPTDTISTSLLPTRSYQALIATHFTTLDPDPYAFWHSSQTAYPGLNLASFQNQQADKLMTIERQNPDTQTRDEAYLKLQDIFKEESPAIFLFSTSYTYVVSKNVSGVKQAIISQPADRFNAIEQWYRDTRRQWQLQANTPR